VIKLQRAAGIEGKLVGFGTTSPVVYAVPLFGGGRWISGTVDGATFRVRGLSPGRYMVSAQTTFEGDGKVVQITGGQIVQLTLTSRGRAAIEATILDFKTNAPVANAACHVVIASEGVLGVTNWDFSSATKSDATGRARLDPSPAGAVTVECALNTEKWSMPSADLTVEPGGRAAVTLYGVELSSENPSDPGLSFDRHRTAPVIATVTPGGNAAKAGVMPGDLVISVDGVSVAKLNASGVDILLRSHNGGDDIVLGVQRGTGTKTFTFFATQ
jgi:PDZ domain-containing protein